MFRLLYTAGCILLLTACTSTLISLSPDADPQERDAEIARILGSSLQSLEILDEDVPRFLEAMEDPTSPQTRQVAVRLLSLKPRADIYQAISLRLLDDNAEVRKEALFALLRADSEFRDILFETAVRPGLYTSDRQALIGRISQFGFQGEQLLIKMLSVNNTSVARIAARNLKRLYPNYDNKPLSRLLADHSANGEFSASAWLASYSDLEAVRNQLLLTASAYPQAAQRARTLYLESGDWILKPTIELLKKNTFSQASIRQLMIQKLIEKNSETALEYLQEFFSYPSSSQVDQQTASFILSYRASAFNILQDCFASPNPIVREKSLSFAMDIVDKKTILAAVTLLNDSSQRIRQLAKEYLQKFAGRFADDLAACFNPEQNLNSDKTLFNILLNEGAEALLKHPHQNNIDSERLFYTFRYINKQQFLEYLKKINKPVYTLELRLIYDLYEQGKTFKSLLKDYRNFPIIRDSENIAEKGLLQENGKTSQKDNSLLQALRLWYRNIRDTPEAQLNQLRKYKNEVSSLYELYLGIHPEYRTVAEEILLKIGLDIEYLRTAATYIPRV